jgi:phosphoribosylformimino-5-aminoimidazole carboxamide ribotide isomerase
MEIIPAIDLLDGRCVRLLKGDYGQVTHYDLDVLDLARRYCDAGLRRLHVVDLNGARDGVGANREQILQLVEKSGLRVQVGGGIRTIDSAINWLVTGVERIVVGSVAILDPQRVLGWLPDVGVERLVPAFDVRTGDGRAEPQAVTHGWRAASGRGLWSLMELYLAGGVSTFLCTDIGRDGTLGGPNIGLYAEARRRFPTARMIASGGIATAADLPILAASGAAAAVTGRALLDGRMSIEEISSFSREG